MSTRAIREALEYLTHEAYGPGAETIRKMRDAAQVELDALEEAALVIDAELPQDRLRSSHRASVPPWTSWSASPLTRGSGRRSGGRHDRATD